jgi:hypothetical protein
VHGIWVKSTHVGVWLVRRAARAAQHWPERTVGEVLAENLVKTEDLFGEATG